VCRDVACNVSTAWATNCSIQQSPCRDVACNVCTKATFFRNSPQCRDVACNVSTKATFVPAFPRRDVACNVSTARTTNCSKRNNNNHIKKAELHCNSAFSFTFDTYARIDFWKSDLSLPKSRIVGLTLSTLS